MKACENLLLLRKCRKKKNKIKSLYDFHNTNPTVESMISQFRMNRNTIQIIKAFPRKKYSLLPKKHGKKYSHYIRFDALELFFWCRFPWKVFALNLNCNNLHININAVFKKKRKHFSIHHYKFFFSAIYNITSVNKYLNMAASLVWTACPQCSEN